MGGPVSAAERARFEELFRATSPDVLAYLARRTAQPADAADLLAEVFLVAWRRNDAVPRGDAARLWLFGVARNVLANQRRRLRAETGLARRLEDELRDVAAQRADESAETVRQALGELSRGDRELLTLNYWEGLSPAEIGAVVGRPAATVRVRLHRARRRLERRLAARRISNAQAVEAMRVV